MDGRVRGPGFGVRGETPSVKGRGQSSWWLGLAVMVTCCGFGAAPVPAAAAEAKVYLVTMHPGEALFTGFGHIAFRIVDPDAGTDDVYDYGTYEANDPLLAWKFLVGTLPYYCSHTTYQDMVAWYSQDFGGIVLQELALTANQIARLRAQVVEDCLPENAAYQYHHFTNNCSTRLRDILDGLLGGQLSQATVGQGAGKSIRDLIDASMARWEFSFTRWLVFGLLNYEIDGEADRWQQMFLPWYLGSELQALRQPGSGGAPVVRSRVVDLGADREEPKVPGMGFGIAVLLVLAGVALLPMMVRCRSPQWGSRLLRLLLLVTGLLAGLYGVLLAFTWIASPYPETGPNLSLLCFHPLHFLLAVAALRWNRSPRWEQLARRYLQVGVVVAALVLLTNLAGVEPQRLWPYALACLALCIPLLGFWCGCGTTDGGRDGRRLPGQ